MLYHWFELSHAAVSPARAAADNYRKFFNNPLNPLTHTTMGRSAAAVCEVFERTTRRYDKPRFDITDTIVDGVTVSVTEEIVWRRPFCSLIRFRRALDETVNAPRILLVAPMSGHFATLLRGTVESFLPDHDVYITDWQDAREVPAAAGAFDLDDYVDTMRDIFHHFGGDVHVFSVCQPSVPVLAAVALMEEAGDPNVPLSLMLAGGPIDTRVSPTAVNRLAQERGTEWFKHNVITTVPWTNRGFGRRVYPGFLQLTGFMTMNLDRHVQAHKDLFSHLVSGDGDGAEKHREFYDEYLAVMDLTADFYLQTIESVFVEHHLPKGTMMHRGKPVDLKQIRRVGLMTIEGEKDDITGLGQCRAALDLTPNIPTENKLHFECPKVGHYGVFNGSRFRSEIAPRMRAFMRRFDPRLQNNSTELPAIERPTAIARANGHIADVDSRAFSFAPANDAEPDAVAARANRHGVAAIANPLTGLLPFGLGASAAMLRFWSQAHSVAIDSWSRSTTAKPKENRAD